MRKKRRKGRRGKSVISLQGLVALMEGYNLQSERG